MKAVHPIPGSSRDADPAGLSPSPRLHHVYLSPHADDVAFSCFGQIAQQRLAGAQPSQLTLVTVFLSNAPQRRREDERAAQLLGCQYRCLELPDAPDRPEIRGDLDLFMRFGPPHLGITNEVLSRLLPWLPPSATLYAPLAVGGHIDHRIAHEAARALAYRVGPSLRLAYYEDLPYALARYALGRRLSALGFSDGERASPGREQAAYRDWLLSFPHMQRRLPGLRSVMAQIAAGAAVRSDGDPSRHRPGFPPRLRPQRIDVGAVHTGRAEVIAAYESQWPLFARSPEALAARFFDYGRALSPDDPATCHERIWFDDGVYGPEVTRTAD
jgi:LmbE family N-acetylglucosaminyl deacetylase